MSTSYYLKKKEPRLVYDEYKIGTTHSGEFSKALYSDDKETMYFNSNEDLIDFINATNQYIILNEYNQEVPKDIMIKIIKGKKYEYKR